MPITTCLTCCGEYHWKWEEAFDKFGFGDGDGQVETYDVAAALERAGYIVEIETWGLHNTLIVSIVKDGEEMMPLCSSEVAIGYDDPRDYLPEEIVRILDRAF